MKLSLPDGEIFTTSECRRGEVMVQTPWGLYGPIESAAARFYVPLLGGPAERRENRT